jgi:hypothetical protein
VNDGRPFAEAFPGEGAGHRWRTLPFHNAIWHSLVFEKPLCDLGWT